MPKGKGTYGSKRGRPPTKRRYEKRTDSKGKGQIIRTAGNKRASTSKERKFAAKRLKSYFGETKKAGHLVNAGWLGTYTSKSPMSKGMKLGIYDNLMRNLGKQTDSKKKKK